MIVSYIYRYIQMEGSQQLAETRMALASIEMYLFLRHSMVALSAQENHKAQFKAERKEEQDGSSDATI